MHSPKGMGAEDLGKRLKQAREARDWGQPELSERSGVSQSMISKIERGDRDPGVGVVGKLEDALGLIPGGLTYGYRGPDRSLADFLASDYAAQIRPPITDREREILSSVSWKKADQVANYVAWGKLLETIRELEK